MSKSSTRPNRSMKKGANLDLGAIDSSKYNEAAGGDKVIIIQPVIERATIANEQVGAGRLIKVAAGGTYDQKCVGRAYDSAKSYNLGDIAVNGGFVYTCQDDSVTGAFDVSKWKKVAAEIISGIPVDAGQVVPTGRWHNAISVAGFLVEDDSGIAWKNQRS